MGNNAIRLPAAPIHRLIRRAILQHGGLNELGRYISRFYNRPSKYGEREISRILAMQDVAFGSVDRICTALRYHPADLYGWDVYLGLRSEETA